MKEKEAETTPSLIFLIYFIELMFNGLIFKHLKTHHALTALLSMSNKKSEEKLDYEIKQGIYLCLQLKRAMDNKWNKTITFN